MRLATVRHLGKTRIVVPHEGGFLDLNRARALSLERDGRYDAAARADFELPGSIRSILERGSDGLDAARRAIDFAAGLDREQLRDEGALLDESHATFLPVIPDAGKFLCVGRNYLEHAQELGNAVNEVPVIFTRFPDSLVGHQQPIVKPTASDALDWEVELAVIIGQRCRHVSRERALDVVAGYTIFDDGTLRDYQKRGVQWTAGKNFYHTGPFGPYFVTADEIPDPQSLQLSAYVNGEKVQDANTAQMIFDIGTLIAHITEWIPLNPGDVIATGTPSGVGQSRQPPLYLKSGDRLKLIIEGLGTLENPVVDEKPVAGS